MGVNSLPKTVARQRHGCDLNPGPTAPESSTPTTRLPSHPVVVILPSTGYGTHCIYLVFILGLFHLSAQQGLLADTRPVHSSVDGKVVCADADTTQLVDEVRKQGLLALLDQLHRDQQSSKELSTTEQYVTSVSKKGSPYSITECRVPELIPVLGRQPAADVSHKPRGKRAATSFAAW